MRTDHLGGTLAARLQSGPLGRDELTQLARDLLEMLAQLHAKGTAHRDLRPDTVRLDGEGRLHSSKIGAQRGAGGDAGDGADDSDVSADLLACGEVLSAAAGPDASAPVMVLIGMLTAEEAVLRPGSATEALALLGGAPAQPSAPSPAPVPRARTVEDTPAPSAPPAPVADAPPVRAADESPEAMTFPPVAAAPLSAPPPLFPLGPSASASEAAPPTAPLPAPPPEPMPEPMRTAAPVPPAARPRRRPSRRIVLLAAGMVLAIGAVLGVLVAVGSGSDDPQTEIPPPAETSLDQQLTDLDGVIDTLGD